MAFQFNSQMRSSKLSSSTIELFDQVDAFEYPVLQPKYHNLGELHNTLTVEITDKLDNDRTHIERISIADIKKRVKELENEKSASERRNRDLLEAYHQTNEHNLRNQLERQMMQFQGYSELEELKKLLLQLEGKPDDFVEEIECTTHRLGYYTRSGNDAKIVLEHTGYSIVFTYIHEMMHVFYDSERVGDSPSSIEYVEEPLAEYGMLKFLKTFVQAHPEHGHLLDDAINNVKGKQYTLGISHYAFGEYLYQNYSHIEWEKLMLNAKNKVDVGSMEYKSLQAIFQTRPNKNNWDKAAQMLHNILVKTNNGKCETIVPSTVMSPYRIDKDTYNQWLERYQKDGVLPSQEEIEGALKNTHRSPVTHAITGPSKVIVRYQQPYESFGPNYGVTLEYDYAADDLHYSITGRGDASKKLTTDQIEEIKTYLRNRQNIEDFFEKAYSTDDIRFGAHYRSHSMSMEYGGRKKSVSNGEAKSWEAPFIKICY